MKTPITPQIINQELIKKVAASMLLDISGMNIEELQAGVVSELDQMEVRNVEALNYKKLVGAFDKVYANVLNSPSYYSSPKDDIGHPLKGMQGTQFDTTGLVESLIEEELGNILSERKKLLDLDAFKKLPPDRRIRRNWLHLNGHKLGEGSSRAVFAIDSSKALKMAINDKGVAQNDAELKTFTSPHFKPLVAEIYDYDPKGEWLISELVRPLSNAEFENKTGFKMWHLEDVIDYLTDVDTKGEKVANRVWEIERVGPEGLKDLIKKSKTSFAQAVWDLVRFEELKMIDIATADHWGKTADGRIVLLDYGYTDEVYRKHYRDNPWDRTETPSNFDPDDPDAPTRVK